MQAHCNRTLTMCARIDAQCNKRNYSRLYYDMHGLWKSNLLFPTFKRSVKRKS